ncbi:solute carrier family 20 (sodium-dependent phosphate transporter) [Marchantia polymorpha subsp. ruderalis]|uniref:Phosphate transporter n=2 Tax=Marchantia polymorpha TaxID=3197 RepID=A0A176WSR1_MARPO|nr:sodium/phosphate symporter PTB7 [Marchantia polymorpha]OAE35864.1 hypothetical protein AXG93_4346s1090 [Marchantia polymorpha subsp. ruderalis]PTQ47433.1 hypothetical protein MARPO_0008s0184 [Marchantia polymorpha]BBN19399.1 hypothetical protein Mp_8g10380 [Marchantia polymorpha subsp. ruderalis]|eukprot:PTQ47433.1 hypothetical protein MARPO_0008s0184 [Marchantia polymorpha]
MANPLMEEYLWLVVVGAFLAFSFGWGTGANDVANAFGTSVGSKTLTLKQAVIIAAIFEFAGAMLLGRVSTNTVASGIADIQSFENHPEAYAYGMVCALLVGSIWLIVTSYYGLNVSSTHTIIGGIIGFSLVWDGADAIKWAEKDPNSFPPYKGVIAIILAWFVSPLLTGGVAAFIFWAVRSIVLRRENAYELAFYTLPPFVLLTTWVNIYFVLTKGARKALRNDNSWSDGKAAWVSMVIAVAFTLISIFVGIPLLKKMARRRFDSDGRPIGPTPEGNETFETEFERNVESVSAVNSKRYAENGINHDLEEIPLDNKRVHDRGAPIEPVSMAWIERARKAATHGVNVDIHKSVKEDEVLDAMHENAERFEPRVEYAFSYLQVFSAICVIFAHGAGEVGYMAGPMAAIWDVYQKGVLEDTVRAEVWIILIAATGLVIGLATYGYNVTRAMGVKLAKITPTRGFSAELATAFVIMIASQYGLPTSSSQCITGAIIGVGILEGSDGVNWSQFLKQFASWVATLFVIGLFTAVVFAQGVYAPSKFHAGEHFS